ncbi:hypothetical protein [Methylobacterium sp. J-070]|uniref:hypothetical protein n=1 Tax=Methylobacterium sp. J-070 TaxID=2836650 RepID=UPI001FBBA057|nr:hypothetical protein [Methylobacterium sp. J-070]MCJ2048800.1 hypothetical protein [Methylobacterium sp. J-070]
MRALLSLTCGAPGRLAISAAALTTLGFLVWGRLDALLVAAFYTVIWGCAFGLLFLALAILGAATNTVDEYFAPATRKPKEDPHGRV